MGQRTEYLSLAGEYAVAGELCRMGIYAQLTLGHRKRTDLLVATERGMLNIQVKTKQAKAWPAIKGITGNDIVLVLVDYMNKLSDQRPDFYILNSKDWKEFIKHGWISERLASGEWELNDENCPILLGKNGKQIWKGCNLTEDDVAKHKEKWLKIRSLVGVEDV